MKLGIKQFPGGWKQIVREPDPAKNIALRILLFLLLVSVIALMFPHPESMEFRYSPGSIWVDKDLVAPFSFPIYKDSRQYETELEGAVNTIYPVFHRLEEVPAAQYRKVTALVTLLPTAAEARGAYAKSRAADDSARYARLAQQIPFSLTPAEWSILSARPGKGAPSPPVDKIAAAANALLAGVYSVGIIDQPKSKQNRATIAIRKGNTEELVVADKLYDREEALAALEEREGTGGPETPLRTLALKIARAEVKPNIVFDQRETTLEIQAAEDNVPRTVGYVEEGERIVSKYDRITEDTRLKLDSYLRARAERGSAYSGWKYGLGIVFHVVLILGLYAIYLFLFRKRIFHDNGKLLIIALLLLMESLFAYFSLIADLHQPLQYLVFVPAASMLLTIIFDSRVAFYGTVSIAFLIAGIRGDDYALALTSLIAGALGAYTVRDIRNRTQIFRSIVFIFLGYFLSIVAISFEQFDSFSSIAVALTFALANAVVSPVLTYGLLIFFERFFRVTTDLTLLELTNFNHPLLREFSEKAPGTFHHSTIIGTLAESAAEVVGANTILARVGGLYHDIGKMDKPEYFIENQVGSHNRHSRLRPRMSALIIGSHVKEGVEIARRFGLPEKVIDFITQHHGTTRMSYFYDKALRQAVKRPTKGTILEDDFRYPGPKPRTKETAIVMLADSVEASVRSITEMTPQKLEMAIENMIKHRFIEGELDECELTLRDLTRIKESFLKILTGIHHQRITYPEEPGAEAEMPAEVGKADLTPSAAEVQPAAQENPPQPQVQSEPVRPADQPVDGQNTTTVPTGPEQVP